MAPHSSTLAWKIPWTEESGRLQSMGSLRVRHDWATSLSLFTFMHWSGLPFPSPMHESEKWKWSCSVMSDSLRPHGLQPTRLLCPWDFPGKSTGVGCHCLLLSYSNLFQIRMWKSTHVLNRLRLALTPFKNRLWSEDVGANTWFGRWT